MIGLMQFGMNLNKVLITLIVQIKPVNISKLKNVSLSFDFDITNLGGNELNQLWLDQTNLEIFVNEHRVAS